MNQARDEDEGGDGSPSTIGLQLRLVGAARPQATKQVLCPVLVGRDEERECLVEAVAGATLGQGSVVLVIGEAGVGKSRLAAEVQDLARQEGFEVVAGRAVEAETPVAFRPLSEGLLSAFRSNGPPRAPELRPFQSALGRLVPEWCEDGASTEASLVIVSEAVLRVLRVLGEGRGCLLLLEDLHWSDPETLGVLEYLADNSASERLLCLGTLRADEPTPALSLARSLQARRSARIMELGRLDEVDTERMAAACLDAVSIPRELVAPMHTWTDGLPFLVEEILAGWVGTGALEHLSEGWSVRSPVGPIVPATFAETVRRRLLSVGLDGERVMTAAAVLGQRFDWELVSAVTGLERTSVMDALRRCMAVQLVCDDGLEGGGRFRLRHALTRDAILSNLLSPEHAELSGLALRAVEELHPTLPGGWCELAQELAEASGDLDRAARLLLLAARRARAQGALITAEASLERARTLAADNPTLQMSLDDVLTEVLSMAGKAEAAMDAGRRLLAAMRQRSAPPARQAEVHLRLARVLLSSGRWPAAREELDQANGMVRKTTEKPLVARISALAAHVALGEGRLDDAAALAGTALTEAERSSLPEVACEALEVIGRRARLLNLPEAEASFERARVIAERHGLAVWLIRALQELASIDVATTRRLDRLTSTRDTARELGALATVAVLDLHIATVLAFRFESEEGLEAARRCAEAARRYHLGGLLLPMAQARQALLPMALVRQAQCHAVRGDANQMETCIAEALALGAGDPEISAGVWGQCRATLSLLGENRARALKELLTGVEFVRGRPDALQWVFRGLWALTATVMDQDGRAARTELAESGLTTLPHHRAFLGYAEAVALGRQGRPDEASNAFATARAEMALAGGGYGFGYLALRLVAECAIADRWGAPIPWLGDAERYFEGVGQRRVASACRSLLRRAGAPAPRRRGLSQVSETLAPLGVSGREQEVLMLVAEKLSNKEIAARLYLSPRTVDKHVEHLLTKTSLHNRAQLSDLAAQIAQPHRDGA